MVHGFFLFSEYVFECHIIWVLCVVFILLPDWIFLFLSSRSSNRIIPSWCTRDANAWVTYMHRFESCRGWRLFTAGSILCIRIFQMMFTSSTYVGHVPLNIIKLRDFLFADHFFRAVISCVDFWNRVNVLQWRWRSLDSFNKVIIWGASLYNSTQQAYLSKRSPVVDITVEWICLNCRGKSSPRSVNRFCGLPLETSCVLACVGQNRGREDASQKIICFRIATWKMGWPCTWIFGGEIPAFKSHSEQTPREWSRNFIQITFIYFL